MEPELQKILHDSVTIDTVYANDTNILKAAGDVLANNRFVQQFNSLNLGSSGISLDIPNKSLCSQTICHMELPEITEDNIYLPRGWAYGMVGRIEWSLGGSMILSQTGETMFGCVMAQCETDHKRAEIVRLAGDEITGKNQGVPRATIHLPLPYSSLRYLGKKLPFDSSLLNQPLRVILYLRTADQLFSGSNVSGRPSALSRGFFQVRQLDFKDAAQGMRNSMIADPNRFYAYPFFYSQSYVSPGFLGSTDSSQPCTVNLVGFRSGNLQSLTLCLQEQHTGAQNIKNLLQFEKLEDIDLTFNGQIIFSAPRNTEGVWCYESGLTDCSFANSIAPLTNLNSPFTTYPVKSFLQTIVLSQFNSVTVDNLLQSGYNIGSQTLSLSFTTPKALQSYKLTVSYNYLCSALTKNSNCEIAF